MTGDTPPKSLMPASSNRAKASDERFGGHCTDTSAGSTTRAAAAVHSSSSSDGSGAVAIFIPGLARKLWTMTSWM
ncbi:MAG TPA: hypothetical protein VNT55_23110 [Baekduia sp.]|nr:hypothetical protein [Baekduia sp.]